ncbi:type IV secretory system conjugative DNA transfer family protein [Arcobacter sp. FWKO B]|uniref:type IV secretory system conjugative DNA transfer family protein n=1 Tax=Arcobacter sp. FWKO B TaxID=2593672 RepID=UPI0018A3FD9E|nr:type IV secretion system DNA-binding domain-containing protein [Arcobacter sp. FWKO B]QOG13041.1 hypothetical protein FWKOB_10225 [Arcobacter sp. FWKO B]
MKNEEEISKKFGEKLDNSLRDTRYRAFEKMQHETEMRIKAYITEYALYLLPLILSIFLYFAIATFYSMSLNYTESRNFSYFNSWFIFALIVGSAATYAYNRLFHKQIKEKIATQHTEITTDNYVKGAKFTNTKDFNKSLWAHIKIMMRGSDDIKATEVFTIKTTELDSDDKNFEDNVEDIIIPRISLSSGLGIFGKPGQGKSVMINQVIQQIPDDKHSKTSIIDVKGEFLQNFYNPVKDVIICPSDLRTHRFDLHELVRTKVDAAYIAEIIVSEDKQTQDPHWTNTARAVFEGVLYEACIKELSNQEIFALISTPELLKEMADENDEIALICGQYLRFEDGNPGKETASILSTLARKAKILQYLAFMDDLKDNPKIVLKKWLNDKKGGKLFLLSPENLSKVFAPLYGVITSYLMIETLSKQDSHNQDLFFVLDELPRLGKILGDNLELALATGRSKGMKIIWAAQSDSQLKENFGDKKFMSILDSTNSLMTFSSNVGAQFSEKYFGKTTVLRNKTGYSMGMDTMADRITINQDLVKEALIDDAEFMRLIPFEFFIKVEGCRDILKAKLERYFLDKKANIDVYIENPKMNILKIEKELERVALNIKNSFVDFEKARNKDVFKTIQTDYL